MNIGTSPSVLGGSVEGTGRLLAAALPLRRQLERRRIVLGAAALLFGAIVVSRELLEGNRDELLGLMFVIPIALVGLELGLRAGIAAALGSLVCVTLLPSNSDPAFDVVGVAMRGVVFVAVGGLAGQFSDRMRAFQARQAQLFAAEHERAELIGELHDMHRRLQDQFRNAGHILDLHEQERRGIAEQLHEQAAQTMAAALLVVGRLERDIVDELTQAQLQRVRHSVRECIAEIRRLAGSLRCPVLEELGLLPALERLFERELEEGSRTIEFRAREELPELPADVEVSAYRVIVDVLDAIPGGLGVHVGLDDTGERLQIAIEAHERFECEGEEIDARLPTTRARLEMVGGSLSCSSLIDRVVITAEIPLTRRLEQAPYGEPDAHGEDAPGERVLTDVSMSQPRVASMG